MKIKLSVCILILFLGFKSLNAQNTDSTKKESDQDIYESAKVALKYQFFSPVRGFVGLSGEIAVNNNINFEIGTNLIGLGGVTPMNYYDFSTFKDYNERGIGFRFGAKFRIKSTNKFEGNRKAFQGPYFNLEMLLNSYKFSYSAFDANSNPTLYSGKVALFGTLGQMGYQHVFHDRLLLDFSLGYGYGLTNTSNVDPIPDSTPGFQKQAPPGNHRFQHGLSLLSENLAFTSQFKIGYIF